MRGTLSLMERQKLFARLLGEFLCWLYEEGFEVTMGEGYVGDSIDSPIESTPHLRNGLHFKRLAQDLNIFHQGAWLKGGDEPQWARIGEKWESMHSLCRWGGRFQDANHFSLTDGFRS